VTLAVCESVPEVPVIVSADVPGGVLERVRTVSVEDVVAELGLKLALAPGGSPLTVIATGELKPLAGVIDTV